MSKRVLALCLLALATSTGCLEVEVKNKAPVTTVALVTVNGTPYSELAKEPTMALPPRLPMGFPNEVAQLFVGAPATVVLQATAKDPDGKIQRYRWLRTDLPRAVRFPPANPPMGTAGMGAAGMGAAGMGAAGMGAAGMGAAGMGAAGMGAAGMAAPAPMGPPAPGAPAGYSVGDPKDNDASITVELPAAGSYRFSVWAVDDKGYISAPASLTVDVRPAPMM